MLKSYSFRLPIFLILLSFIFINSTALTAQMLIDPAGDGGFENGPDFADNGWTLVNGSVANQWFMGNIATGFTGRSAFISDNSGVSHAYTDTSISVVHF